MKTCLAVDLGGTKLSAALVKNGLILKKQQIETGSSQCPSVLIDRLTYLLNPMVKEADRVAVASTGIIDNGILTALNPDNLGGLNQFPLQEIVSRITQLPTVVINDAQAAAWSEYHAYHCEYQNMAFITVSTGVGAGFVLEGKLITGARGVAGHAGHMLSDRNGPRCGCGRVGCVEVMASGRAIAREGQLVFGENCTGKDVYNNYLNNQIDAEKIIKGSAFAIAQLVADLTIALDLDAVVLGGSVGLAKNYLHLVKESLFTLPCIYQPKVLPAICGVDAGLIGVSQWFHI